MIKQVKRQIVIDTLQKIAGKASEMALARAATARPYEESAAMFEIVEMIRDELARVQRGGEL